MAELKAEYRDMQNNVHVILSNASQAVFKICQLRKSGVYRSREISFGGLVFSGVHLAMDSGEPLVFHHRFKKRWIRRIFFNNMFRYYHVNRFRLFFFI